MPHEMKQNLGPCNRISRANQFTQAGSVLQKLPGNLWVLWKPWCFLAVVPHDPSFFHVKGLNSSHVEARRVPRRLEFKGKVTVIGLSRLEPMRLPPFTRVEPHQNQSLQAHDSPSNPHRTNEPAAAPLEACLMSIRDCSLRGSSTSTASLGRRFPSVEFQVSKDFFCSHCIFLH